MPLQQGASRQTISANIAELIKAGHEPKQAAAIAYAEARKTAADMTPAQWLEMGLPELSLDSATALSGGHSDAVAFDRASVRRVDKDGHLHVETTPISKANVCVYMGQEIPNWETLGLDPQKEYRLYRDPDELKKGAPTFDGKPILLVHKPVNAADHPREIVVGALGDDVNFRDPYLMAPLHVHDGEAIGLIDSGEQKELSSSYRYRADMTPGTTADGEPFDGVMRDIVGNHVALVKEGRAGPDVMVGDSKPKPLFDFAALFARDESAEAKARAEGKLSERTREEVGRVGSEQREDEPDSEFLEPASKKYPVKKNGKYDRNLLLAAAREARMHGHEDMAKRADAIRNREFGGAADAKETVMTKLSRQAAFAQGVLCAYLRPKLATDAKIDLAGLLKGMKKFNDAATITALRNATKDKLAKDASIEDVEKVLDLIDKEKPADDDLESNAAAPAGKSGRLAEFLKGKGMGEDDIKAACDMVDEQEAMDETEEEKKAREEKEKAARDAEIKAATKGMVDEKAMDAAIDKAVSAAVKGERQRNVDIRTAEEDVRPYVGKLALAHDSAEAVYRTALTGLGIAAADVASLPASALKVILKNIPIPGRNTPHVAAPAMDSAAVTSFHEMFPAAKTHIVKTL